MKSPYKTGLEVSVVFLKNKRDIHSWIVIQGGNTYLKKLNKLKKKDQNEGKPNGVSNSITNKNAWGLCLKI